MVDAIEQKGVVVGKPDFLQNRRGVRQRAVLAELLGYIFLEAPLAVFVGNVLLHSFEKHPIHICSPQCFRAHLQQPSLPRPASQFALSCMFTRQLENEQKLNSDSSGLPSIRT